MGYGMNNDAGSTSHILSLHEAFLEWLKKVDVYVIDKGFRDVLYVFEKSDFETKMPAFLKQGTSKHTFEKANQSC